MAHRNQIIPVDAPSPRLCSIRKTHAGQEYGFNLHAERNKSQYVGAVDAGSPAEIGALKQGDRIMGVNGALIGSESHKEVVQRIKADPNQCELLVIDAEGLKWYENNGIAISYDMPNIIRSPEQITTTTQRASFTTAPLGSGSISKAPRPAPIMSPRPLLCHLRKQRPTDEFGFNLHAERNKGHFIGAVDNGGIAEHAGLETGQRIVGVNGKLVYPTSQHKEVVALIKGDPLETSLLVASEEVDRWYTENGIPYSFDLAIVHESSRRDIVVAPVPASRTTTVVSHQTTNGTQPQSRHNSVMMPDDHATNTVYIPAELQPTVEENPEIVVVPATAPSLDSASELIEEMQDVENAAVGADSEDLLEQVFARVNPPEVEAAHLREQNGLADALADAQIVAPAVAPAALHDDKPHHHHEHEHEAKHTITNYNSAPLTVSPSGSHHHYQQHPQTTYTPASQYGTGLSSPHSDKRSLDSPDFHKDENIDIFKLSAKEARQLMRHKRKDPRMQANMTLEEKHQLIANL